MRNIQNAFDALANYGPALEGQWTIQLASGTYSAAGDLERDVHQAAQPQADHHHGGDRCLSRRAHHALSQALTGFGLEVRHRYGCRSPLPEISGVHCRRSACFDDKTRAALSHDVHTFNCLTGLAYSRPEPRCLAPASRRQSVGFLGRHLGQSKAGSRFDSADFRRHAIAVLGARERGAVSAGTIYSFNNATANETLENYRVQGSAQPRQPARKRSNGWWRIARR